MQPLAFARRLTSAAMLLGTLAVVSPLRGQHAPPVSAGRAVGQGALALAFMPVGFVGGGLGTRWVARHLGATDDAASTIALIGAYTTAVFTTAAGPAIVGAGPHASGSYGASLLGTAIGGGGSVLLVRLNKAVNTGPVLRIVSGVAVVLLPSVGATVGYNLSRSYRR